MATRVNQDEFLKFFEFLIQEKDDSPPQWKLIVQHAESIGQLTEKYRSRLFPLAKSFGQSKSGPDKVSLSYQEMCDWFSTVAKVPRGSKKSKHPKAAQAAATPSYQLKTLETEISHLRWFLGQAATAFADGLRQPWPNIISQSNDPKDTEYVLEWRKIPAKILAQPFTFISSKTPPEEELQTSPVPAGTLNWVTLMVVHPRFPHWFEIYSSDLAEEVGQRLAPYIARIEDKIRENKGQVISSSSHVIAVFNDDPKAVHGAWNAVATALGIPTGPSAR